MIRLWYSNYLEELVEALVGNVRALRQAGAVDPFDVTTVIVPNRNIATYLKFAICRRTGILANWHFEYLYRFFRDAVTEDGVQILAKDDLHTLLLDVLADDDLLAEPELGSVASYLDAARTTDARDRRRWQLAAELARVFEEYSLSRPRMLALWPNGSTIDNEPFASTERWQRRLWLEIFGDGGRLREAEERRGKRLLLMPDVFTASNAELDLPPQIHVFGLSYVARSFYKLFAELAERTPLLVYTLNPCMEYWEDVPSGWNLGHARQWERRDAEQTSLLLFDEEEVVDDSPPALRAWGRPGRNNIHMLNLLTECDFAARFVDPVERDGDTLLHRLQRDILVRQPVSAHPDRRYEDDSITVVEAPNVQREIEAVASQILDLKRRYAARDETLEFHEIAVIVNNAEREAYQARIRSVFEATHEIPHNIIDITASAHRRYLEAVELLLDLPFGRFTRRELLRLLTHDNVVARCPGVDPQTWVRWCDELNILHGADRQDHEGTYIDRNLYHWDQGLKRLVLGTFMTGQIAGDERIAKMPDGEYLPLELSPQEVESAAQLVTLARSMIADARWMASTRMLLSEWMDVIVELLHTYLETVDDDDEYDRLRVVRRFRELADRSLSKTPVSFRVAREFAASVLSGLEISRGQYLSEGVVVSSFLPMRPIPFKVVFVTGLGERYFPRSEVRSPLDLRWSPELKPLRGDVVSARAQDEYMFLETLISTRDRMILSYVARDSQTGEELEPSSVLRLLWFMLEQNYVTPENLTALRVEHPLRRWDDEAYFGDEPLPNYQPEARREATALNTRLSLEEFCHDNDVPRPPRATLERDLDAARRDVLHRRLGLIEPPDGPTGPVEDRITVPLYQIRKFLESPVQGAAQFYLGMREDDFEDPFGVEDEVFETAAQQQMGIMREAFLRTLVEATDDPPDETLLEEQYAHLARRAVLQGTVPAGPFGEADRKKHVRVLRQWLRNWRGLRLSGEPSVVNFGQVTTEHAALLRREEPLRMSVEVPDGATTRQVEVDIVGKTEVLWGDDATSMVLTGSRRLPRGGGGERFFLRGFLDQVILAAAEIRPFEEWTVAVNVFSDLREQYHVRRYDPFDPVQARGWLRLIVEDMLSSMPSYFLPIEAVFAHRYARKKRSLQRWLDEYSEWYSWCAYKSGPVHEPQNRFDPPPDAEAIIARRFGAYFERRQEVE
jgi:exodeoxyribonuclease V gamma subunit